MSANQLGEAAVKVRGLGSRRIGDLTQVTLGPGMPARGEEERGDDDRPVIEGRGRKQFEQQRAVELVGVALRRFHRGGRQGAHLFAQGLAQVCRHAVPQGRRGAGRSAVIHNDDRGLFEASRREPDALGRDRGHGPGPREPGGEGIGEASLTNPDRLDVGAQGRPDGPLVADEERDERELPLPLGQFSPEPGFEGVRGNPVECRRLDPVAVLPRDRLDRLSRMLGDSRGDGPQVPMGVRLDRPVVNEGDRHWEIRAIFSGLNQVRTSA